MDKEIVVALISATASIVGSYSIMNYRLKKLEEKVDKHNAWGEKFQSQSTDIALIQKDISYIKQSIERIGGK